MIGTGTNVTSSLLALEGTRYQFCCYPNAKVVLVLLKGGLFTSLSLTAIAGLMNGYPAIADLWNKVANKAGVAALKKIREGCWEEAVFTSPYKRPWSSKDL